MDASTYLRRKKESMPQYIHRPVCVDASTRTERIARAAGSAYYVSPNVKPAVIPTCLTSKPAVTGNVDAIKVLPGCASDVGPITLSCCSMIYEPETPVTSCKVEPYVDHRYVPKCCP